MAATLRKSNAIVTIKNKQVIKVSTKEYFFHNYIIRVSVIPVFFSSVGNCFFASVVEGVYERHF